MQPVFTGSILTIRVLFAAYIQVFTFIGRFLVLIFVSVSGLALFPDGAVSAQEADSPEDGITVVAHRGGSADRPENTMAAFRRALETGADLIEIDLRTSRDGRLFILHDEKLDRTTGASGPAGALTLEELRSLDAGSWFDSTYAGECIPSFRQVLEWAIGENVLLLLDLKESGRAYNERVAYEVLEYGREEGVVVGVRSTNQARRFRELLPAARQLGFIDSPLEIEAYAAAGVDVIRLWLRWLDEDPSLTGRVRRSGVQVMINGTAGGLPEAKTIMQYHPDWILVDDPARLQRSLDRLREQ